MTIFTEEFRDHLCKARNRQNWIEDRHVIELLVAEVLRLEDVVRNQNARLTDYSWTVNPDKSGGAFTQDEINRSRDGGW